MNHRIIFRIVVLMSLLLSVFSGVCDFIIPNEPLEKLILYSLELEPVGYEFGMLEIGFIVIGLTLVLVAFVGLMLFKNWGRVAFILCGVVGLPYMIIGGPYISSGLGGSLYDLSNVASGVVLAMMFLSPISDKFKI